MKLEAPIGPKRRLAMTPLVDVIFLLLMFFMLSSTFSRFSALQLDRTQAVSTPSAQKGKTTGQPRAIFVTIDGVGNVRLGGKNVELERLVQAVNRFYDSGARAVVILPRGGANVQDLVSVIERIKISKIKTITMAN